MDDVYALLKAAKSKTEIVLLPLFAKARKYQHQREYRFVMWAQTEPTEETVLMQASPALTAAMGREFSTGEPQVMPPFESLEEKTNEGEDDCQDEYDADEYDAGFDQSDVSLIDRIGQESNALNEFRQRVLERADDPATVVRPNKLEPAAALPCEFESLTTMYSAVQTLRNSVNSVRNADNMTPQQKLEAASAAWYAEQHIRSVCEVFDDPISGISISPDGFVVVEISLHGRPDITCKMAVAPSGECAMQMTAQGIPSTVQVETPWCCGAKGQSVREFLEHISNLWRRNDNVEPLQEPP